MSESERVLQLEFAKKVRKYVTSYINCLQVKKKFANAKKLIEILMNV